MPQPRAFAVFAFIFFAAAISVLNAAPWPEVDSDLPAHPALRQGMLANGLRYAILPNAEPQDRISLRLLVAVGSLHENDDERGLAHYVEHMAFRGTRTHPAGSLTAALQRLGLGPGPDSAAFTYFDHTIYHLELPDANERTLHEGLQVFREFASEITFDPKLIERERGVILSELATRDTPAARSSEHNLSFLWPQSRQAARRVGGTSATVRHFTHAQFAAFYDAWYRPERMAVVVVGQIDPAAAEKLIEAELGRLGARAPARPEPADLIPAAASGPDVGIFADPGLIGVVLTFEHPVYRPRIKDTHDRRVERLHESLAFVMFHQRLQAIAHEPGASFLGPIAQISGVLPEWQLATLSVSGKIDDWKQVATDVEHEHRRAFQFGFTAQELETARAAVAAAHEQAARTQATRPSDWLAGRLAACLLAGVTFTRAQDVQRDLAGPLAAATLEDCRRGFREAWTTAAPHVFIAAHPSFEITRQQIGAVLNESRASDVTPREEHAAVAFAYEDFGPPGELVREDQLADLDVRLTEFANGVRLNFKATDFEADTVEVHLRVGAGKLVQPEQQPGLDLLANFALTAGGLGRHTAQELTTLLAGRSLRISFRVDNDACVFTLRCGRRDLALSLQIVAAFLTDAAFRPELMRDARAAFSSMFASLAASPAGPISVFAPRELANGDRRFGLPQADELFSRQLDEVRAWLEPQFKRGAIEMSIVGDTTWDEARVAVARTLGALGPREPRRTPAEDRQVHPPLRPPPAPRVFAIDAKLQQGALAWFWPVPALPDIHEERRCRLLAAVLHERCRVRLREELGAAYSPAAGFVDTKGFPHLNYFSAYAEVPPARARQAMQIIQREAMALAARGVDADEFTRAKQPFLRERSDNVRTNIYWGTTVLSDAQERPDRIAAARDRAADTAAITAAEISRLAKRYLDPAKSFKFATAPTWVPPAPARSSGNSKSAASTTMPPR